MFKIKCFSEDGFRNETQIKEDVINILLDNFIPFSLIWSLLRVQIIDIWAKRHIFHYDENRGLVTKFSIIDW